MTSRKIIVGITAVIVVAYCSYEIYQAVIPPKLGTPEYAKRLAASVPDNLTSGELVNKWYKAEDKHQQIWVLTRVVDYEGPYEADDRHCLTALLLNALGSDTSRDVKVAALHACYMQSCGRKYPLVDEVEMLAANHDSVMVREWALRVLGRPSRLDQIRGPEDIEAALALIEEDYPLEPIAGEP